MLNRKGQSTVEYALIIAVVVAGLLLMQHYVKRGYAGRLKSSSDEMGDQFDPAAYSGNLTTHQESHTKQEVKDRTSTTTHTGDQLSTRTGDEHVGAWAPGQDLYSE